MADSSFDIVSKIDHQEVANALNSAARAVATRYDFKNVGASIEASGEDKVVIKRGCSTVMPQFQMQQPVPYAYAPQAAPQAAPAGRQRVRVQPDRGTGVVAPFAAGTIGAVG